MDQNLRVTKNSFSLLTREALNKGALFILMIFVARCLGKEALGRYTLAFAISHLFFFAAELGLGTLIIREVARRKDLAAKALVSVSILRVISGAAAIAMIWVTTLILGARGEAASAIYLCAFSYFVINIINVYTVIFRAYEKMELELLVSVIRNALFVPISLWLLFAHAGIVSIFTVFLAVNIAGAAWAHVIFIRRIGRPRLEFDLGFCLDKLRQAAPLWLGQLFNIAYLKLAPLLLFKLKGEGQVGLYNAGLVVVDGFWVAASAFAFSLFPTISRLHVVSMEEARREYVRGLKFIGLLFAGLGICLIAGAGAVVNIFYGRQFIEAAPLFKILPIAAMLVALDTHNGLTIVATGRQRVLPVIMAAGLFVNLLVNIACIPGFGYIGSAYALVASEGLVFVLMSAALARHFLKGRIG